MTPRDIILEPAGGVYLDTDDTHAFLGRWVALTPPRGDSKRNYMATVGPDSKQVQGRSHEALKRAIVDLLT